MKIARRIFKQIKNSLLSKDTLGKNFHTERTFSGDEPYGTVSLAFTSTKSDMAMAGIFIKI